MRREVARGLAPLIVLCFVSAGCAAIQSNPKASLGGALGAAGGGLIASAAGGDSAAIAGAVILGGLLGGAAGNALDQRDKQLAMQRAQLSLENGRSGQTSTWQNPDSGNSGTFTPTRTYQTQSGQYCREYTQTIMVGGERQQSYGTACRMPDGTWKVQ
jgi:surface antigen